MSNGQGYAALAQAAVSVYQSFQSIKDAKAAAKQLAEAGRRQREASATNTARMLQDRVAQLGRLQDALQAVQYQANDFRSALVLNQGITQNYSNTAQILQADIDKQEDRARIRLLRNQQQADVNLNQQIQAEADSLKQSPAQIKQPTVNYADGISAGINGILAGFEAGAFDKKPKPNPSNQGIVLYGNSTGFTPQTSGSIDLTNVLNLK
jgi:hypothetical protein|nr:MAG TPA: hypothetical protein [Caudoviricetes sp.]